MSAVNLLLRSPRTEPGIVLAIGGSNDRRAFADVEKLEGSWTCCSFSSADSLSASSTTGTDATDTTLSSSSSCCSLSVSSSSALSSSSSSASNPAPSPSSCASETQTNFPLPAAHSAAPSTHSQTEETGGNNGGSRESFEIPSLLEARFAHASCVTPSNEVFTVGGSDGSVFLRSSEMYCPEAQRWTPLPKLQFSRAYLGVCSLVDGRVVALGGQGGKSALRSVEMYDPHKKNWRVLPPMVEPRQSCAAVAIGMHVYALGGRDEGGSHGKVQRFCEALDVTEGPWQTIKPMKQARYGLAAVAFRGRIYVVGGTNGVKPLTSVEVYNPQRNSWSVGPSLQKARAWASVIVWDDCIVTIGGRESTSQEVVDSVEVWRPEGAEMDEGSWREKGRTGLPADRWMYTAVAINPKNQESVYQTTPYYLAQGVGCSATSSAACPSSASSPASKLVSPSRYSVASPGSSVAAVAAKFGFVGRGYSMKLKAGCDSGTSEACGSVNGSSSSRNAGNGGSSAEVAGSGVTSVGCLRQASVVRCKSSGTATGHSSRACAVGVSAYPESYLPHQAPSRGGSSDRMRLKNDLPPVIDTSAMSPVRDAKCERHHDPFRSLSANADGSSSVSSTPTKSVMKSESPCASDNSASHLTAVSSSARPDGLEQPRMRNLLPQDVLVANQLFAGHDPQAHVSSRPRGGVVEMRLGDDEDDEELQYSTTTSHKREDLAFQQSFGSLRRMSKDDGIKKQASKVEQLRANFESSSRTHKTVNDPLSWLEE